jgi:hypothetical protein
MIDNTSDSNVTLPYSTVPLLPVRRRRYNLKVWSVITERKNPPVIMGGSASAQAIKVWWPQSFFSSADLGSICARWIGPLHASRESRRGQLLTMAAFEPGYFASRQQFLQIQSHLAAVSPSSMPSSPGKKVLVLQESDEAIDGEVGRLCHDWSELSSPDIWAHMIFWFLS